MRIGSAKKEESINNNRDGRKKRSEVRPNDTDYTTRSLTWMSHLHFNWRAHSRRSACELSTSGQKKRPKRRTHALETSTSRKTISPQRLNKDDSASVDGEPGAARHAKRALVKRGLDQLIEIRSRKIPRQRQGGWKKKQRDAAEGRGRKLSQQRSVPM